MALSDTVEGFEVVISRGGCLLPSGDEDGETQLMIMKCRATADKNCLCLVNRTEGFSMLFEDYIL